MSSVSGDVSYSRGVDLYNNDWLMRFLDDKSWYSLS